MFRIQALPHLIPVLGCGYFPVIAFGHSSVRSEIFVATHACCGNARAAKYFLTTSASQAGGGKSAGRMQTSLLARAQRAGEQDGSWAGAGF
jgi:hypothetical protein